MSLPTLQQAIDAASELMTIDSAISSVVIQFQTSTGLAFEATFSGFIRDVKRLER